MTFFDDLTALIGHDDTDTSHLEGFPEDTEELEVFPSDRTSRDEAEEAGTLFGEFSVESSRPGEVMITPISDVGDGLILAAFDAVREVCPGYEDVSLDGYLIMAHLDLLDENVAQDELRRIQEVLTSL